MPGAWEEDFNENADAKASCASTRDNPRFIIFIADIFIGVSAPKKTETEAFDELAAKLLAYGLVLTPLLELKLVPGAKSLHLLGYDRARKIIISSAIDYGKRTDLITVQLPKPELNHSNAGRH